MVIRFISKRLLFLSCLLLCKLPAASAQELHFDHISLEQGLSQSIVNCILQDEQGFLWFGTDDGLNRYDGYEFVVYRHEPHNGESLSDNQVSTLVEGRSGRIWIGTARGLNYFDREEGIFHQPLPRGPGSHAIEGQVITALWEDNKETLWIGTEKRGLFHLDPKSGHIRHFESGITGAGSLLISCIWEDTAGYLWVGTHNGLLRIAPGAEETAHFRRGVSGLRSPFIKYIYQDNAGALWVTTDNALHLYDEKAGAFKAYPHPFGLPDLPRGEWRSYILEDSREEGHLWLGAQQGLSYFDSRNGTFTTYQHNSHNPNSLSGDFITAIYETREGILWIGSRSRGLNKLDPTAHRFLHHKHEPGNPNSLSHNDVFSIVEDQKGRLWIATRSGLNRLNRATQTFTHYKHSPGNPNSLSTRQVNCLYADSKGQLWAGTTDGLNRYEPGRESFEVFRNDAYPAQTNYLNCILEDENGALWIGNRYGLSHFTPADGRFRNIENALLSDVTCLKPDPMGRLWLGSSTSGLFLYDPKTEALSRFAFEPDNPNSLSSNSVWALHLEDKGVLWIATYGGGLNRYDPDSGIFTSFTAQSAGFPTNNLDAMLADDDGRLWIGTDNGLVRFDPQTRETRIFGLESGIQSKEFHQKSQYKSQSGELFFGGINGFNAFFPDEADKRNPVPPQIVVTGLKLNNEPVPIGGGSPLSQHISRTGKLTLKHFQNDLSFEFTALHFAKPAQNKYACKLEPYEKEWKDAGSGRSATYTNLDPGRYTLYAKAANSDGIWTEEKLLLSFTIRKPWWKTVWAYLFYVLALVSLVYALRRYELNRLKLQTQLQLEQVEAEKFRELNRMKSRFFANISHEFRTPLTLVLGQIDAIASELKEGKGREKLNMAKRNARRLLNLVGQLLDLSKLEAGNMELQLVRNDVVPLLKNLFFSFESLAEEKNISLVFNCLEEEIILDYEPDKLEKIVINLLSNAFKFTPDGGEVSLSVARSELAVSQQITRNRRPATTNQLLSITVHDSGIGIPPEQQPHVFNRFYQVDSEDTRKFEGTGIGLALVKELVELHGGAITVKSEVGRGTEFSVLLPLEQAKAPEHLTSNEVRLQPLSKPSAPSTGKPAGPAESRPAGTGRELLLIVEDNADVRHFIRETLEPAYSILEAEDGEQGLELAREHIPDLIISDVMMPKMDGYTFSRKIREEERSSHIPIIMLTAKAGEEDKISGLQTGVDAYLIKPFNARELRVRITNLIALRRKLRERFSRATVIRPSEVSAESADQVFLKKVLGNIEEHMGEEAYTVEALAAEMNMSDSQLNRKLNALIGQPPGQLIRSMRLQRAAGLLKQGAGNVSEIAYATGFPDAANFSRAFKKQFGLSPSKYQKKHS
ncbi:MAG: response regulator [Phaeodactylibacter sp.]|nr:response regulator [Phaeodactylibacter sp.]